MKNRFFFISMVGLTLLVIGCGDKPVITREGDGSRLQGRDSQTGQKLDGSSPGTKPKATVDQDGNRGGG